MPDATLDTADLHTQFIADLGDLAGGSSDINVKPLDLVLLPPLPETVRVYLYNVTSPPGGRPADEHKIQLIAPGQGRDEPGNFDFSSEIPVVLIGFSPSEDVYVMWDAALHRDFSWSANAQVKGETLLVAADEGLATQQRQLRSFDETETVIVVPAGNLVDGLLARLELGFSTATDASARVVTSGVTYREADTGRGTSKRRVFEVDPDLFDRATKAHATTQNALRDRAVDAGFEPRSPKPTEPQFDVAWMDGETARVVEVKSITRQNEVRQIRYAIGQVLDYCFTLQWDAATFAPVIALEREPWSQYWVDLCGDIGVDLVWPDTFHKLFA